jgi:hypothetical protein
MGGRNFKRHGKVIWPGVSEIAQRHVVKIGRNDPCPCGSSRKFKDCHEKEGAAFLDRLALEDDRRRREEARERMKAEGVPWYRRWLRW